MDKTENSAPEALCAKLSVQSLWHPLLRFFFFFFGGNGYVTSAVCSSKWPALIRFLFLRRAVVSVA